MNAAFHTELHDFIYDRPQVKLWIHGHTHDDFDYVINQTRVVCNPRGYVKYEDRVNTWALKYYEV
jgi:calcineurin-like phosphoesterase family protein